MIDILSDYIRDSLPASGVFMTNHHLPEKVDENGAFRPFYGNTCLYWLDADTKAAVTAIQDDLYNCAGHMLAERIAPETFHMTLHDLVNSPEYSRELEQKMALARERAGHILSWWETERPLRMRATRVFNMVSTSVVLGLAPADEDSRYRLEAMYRALEAVEPLGYAMTPHITLAYFRPGMYDGEDLNRLRQAMQPVTLELELKAEQLCLQSFLNMNKYQTYI